MIADLLPFAEQHQAFVGHVGASQLDREVVLRPGVDLHFESDAPAFPSLMFQRKQPSRGEPQSALNRVAAQGNQRMSGFRLGISELERVEVGKSASLKRKGEKDGNCHWGAHSLTSTR